MTGVCNDDGLGSFLLINRLSSIDACVFPLTPSALPRLATVHRGLVERWETHHAPVGARCGQYPSRIGANVWVPDAIGCRGLVVAGAGAIPRSASGSAGRCTRCHILTARRLCHPIDMRPGPGPFAAGVLWSRG